MQITSNEFTCKWLPLGKSNCLWVHVGVATFRTVELFMNTSCHYWGSRTCCASGYHWGNQTGYECMCEWLPLGKSNWLWVHVGVATSKAVKLFLNESGHHWGSRTCYEYICKWLPLGKPNWLWVHVGVVTFKAVKLFLNAGGHYWGSRTCYEYICKWLPLGKSNWL